MEHRVKKYNGISPGTFYAVTDGEARDSGPINFPIWIVSTETGKLTEVPKGEAYYGLDLMNKAEYLIRAVGLTFSIDTHQDLFKDKFRSVSAEGCRKGLNFLKGKHILFLEQRAAAVKAREILLKRQQKINEELDMINSLISF